MSKDRLREWRSRPLALDPDHDVCKARGGAYARRGRGIRARSPLITKPGRGPRTAGFSAVSGWLSRALAPQGVRGQRPARRGQPTGRQAAVRRARGGLAARTPPAPPRFTQPGPQRPGRPSRDAQAWSMRWLRRPLPDSRIRRGRSGPSTGQRLSRYRPRCSRAPARSGNQLPSASNWPAQP